MEGDAKWVDVIERDLHRQFPFHEMFVSRGGHGLVFIIFYSYIYKYLSKYCETFEITFKVEHQFQCASVCF